MQRDIIYEVIKKETKGNPQEFWDFLASKQGVNWWVDLFDSSNPRSITRPEVLRKSISVNLSAED